MSEGSYWNCHHYPLDISSWTSHLSALWAALYAAFAECTHLQNIKYTDVQEVPLFTACLLKYVDTFFSYSYSALYDLKFPRKQSRSLALSHIILHRTILVSFMKWDEYTLRYCNHINIARYCMCSVLFIVCFALWQRCFSSKAEALNPGVEILTTGSEVNPRYHKITAVWSKKHKIICFSLLFSYCIL